MFTAEESLGVVFEPGDKGSPQWHLGACWWGAAGVSAPIPMTQCPGVVPGAAPGSSPPGPRHVLMAAPYSTQSSLLAKCLGPLLTIPRG